VSEPNEIDPARAVAFVERLLAEEMAESVESMSDERVAAELRKGGVDPARIPSAEQLLARVEPRAAVGPDGAKEAGSRGAGRVVALDERRRTRWVLMLAAAMFVLVVVVVIKQVPAIVAYWRHGTHDKFQIGPDNDWVPPRGPPTPHEQAEALRDEAVAACEGWLWAMCRGKLDEAQKLDPAGESAERVQAARREILEKLNPDGGDGKGTK
jgi:hypothetical protein